MKKILFLLIPFFGLNAQVTIGEENQTSAMLNITMPNSIFVMPVGDRNLVNTEVGSIQVNDAVPEGSMMYHSAPTAEDSGLFLRVKSSSNTSRSESVNSLEWKPFKVNRRTYIYNNIQSKFNEQLLGYSPKSIGNRFDANECFVWSISENNPGSSGNGHTYCLVDYYKHEILTPEDDSRIDQNMCDRANWGCGFAVALMDGGYLATITSQEELNFVKTQLQSRSNLIQSSKIVIGLRRLNVNEGDRTKYGDGASLISRSTWVNGEQNKVGWLTNSNTNINSTNSLQGTGNCGVLTSDLNIFMENCEANDLRKVLIEYNF